jgi:hypothetical protein
VNEAGNTGPVYPPVLGSLCEAVSGTEISCVIVAVKSGEAARVVFAVVPPVLKFPAACVNGKSFWNPKFDPTRPRPNTS